MLNILKLQRGPITSSIRSIIFGATTHSIPTEWGQDSWIWSCVKLVNIANSGYHFLNRVKRYNSDNALLIVSGVALEVALGDKKIVNAIAKILEASLHSLKAIKAYVRFHKSVEKIKRIIALEEGRTHLIDIERASKLPILSTSTWVYLIDRKETGRMFFMQLLDAIFEMAANFILMCSHTVQACHSLEGHAFQVIEAPMNIAEIFHEIRDLDAEVFKKINDSILSEMGATFKSKEIFDKFVAETPPIENSSGKDIDLLAPIKEDFAMLKNTLRFALPSWLRPKDELPTYRLPTGNSKRGTVKIVKDLKSIPHLPT